MVAHDFGGRSAVMEYVVMDCPAPGLLTGLVSRSVHTGGVSDLGASRELAKLRLTSSDVRHALITGPARRVDCDNGCCPYFASHDDTAMT